MFKILEWITEAVGWLQIVASPFLIALGIGAIVYFPNQTIIRLIIAVIIASVGLITGVTLATKIWKTDEGTIAFLSRIMSTTEDGRKKKETQESYKGNKKR